MIEHVPTIVDMRRYLVMNEARVPATAQSALENIEQRGHPWRGTALTRESWMEDFDDVPIFDGSQEYLYWVGCSGSLVERNLPITKAVFRLLREAGASFGVLGQEETCNGDPARRLGNEYLYQILATQLIETFQAKNVQKVITNCPHCFNTFRNEFPQFDGRFEVLHHTEFLDRALPGRQAPPPPPGRRERHLPRLLLPRPHERRLRRPRQILEVLPGVELTEMRRSRSKGLCCGAGGGNIWQEEIGERRVTTSAPRRPSRPAPPRSSPTARSASRCSRTAHRPSSRTRPDGSAPSTSLSCSSAPSSAHPAATAHPPEAAVRPPRRRRRPRRGRRPRPRRGAHGAALRWRRSKS